MYNKCIFSTILSTVLSARKSSGSSLKPSSCCLRQSQTVDLTLYGVSEHMQRRGIEHDRWTYESTAGLWKIVTKEATRGDPTSVHTPSTVSVHPHSKAMVLDRREHVRLFLCICTLVHVYALTNECNCMHISVFVWNGQIKVRCCFIPTCSH